MSIDFKIKDRTVGVIDPTAVLEVKWKENGHNFEAIFCWGLDLRVDGYRVHYSDPLDSEAADKKFIEFGSSVTIEQIDDAVATHHARGDR